MTYQSALQGAASNKGRLVTAILGALLGALGAHAAGPATVTGCPCDGVVMAPPVPCPVCPPCVACPLAGDTTVTVTRD
jgi:hypothetical protein